MRNWSKLNHENIVKLEGFLLDDLNPPSATIVSSWADGGTVDDYVREHPDCDQVEIVRATRLQTRLTLKLHAGCWDYQRRATSSQ